MNTDLLFIQIMHQYMYINILKPDSHTNQDLAKTDAGLICLIKLSEFIKDEANCRIIINYFD